MSARTKQDWIKAKPKLDKQRKDAMKRLIDYKGGRCEVCGYNKCIAALDFHHIDPNAKLFGIAQSLTRDWISLILEADKCLLLCSNCHRELHYMTGWTGKKKETINDNTQLTLI
jgi:hypothetical protein